MLSRIVRRTAALIALPVLVVACTSSAAEEPTPDTSEMVTVETTGPDMRKVQRMFETAEATEQYVFALYVAAVEWDRWWDVAMAEWDAEQARLATVQSSSSSGGSNYSYVGEGDCYANDIPDYIISRESGGNPNAQNPSSSAWGCAQWLESTWNSTCGDLGAHGSAPVSAQNECANRLWDGGAGASHWQATL